MTVTNAQLKTLIENQATTTNSNFKKAKQALNNKVDKVSGKGLSTNDYTTTEKNKLGALPTNAELEAGYVAKDGSKVLSDNNFTDALKTKLEGLSNAPDVTIEAAATPDSGMAATYQLKVGGVATGAKINVAKDKFIGTPIIKTCETANTPLTGLAVGDKYVEFPITNSSEKQYMSVKDLYNVYQAGNGITFDGNSIKIDTTVVATKSDIAGMATQTWVGQQGFLTSHQDISGKQNNITSSNKLDADLVDDSSSTNKFVTAADKATWNGKQSALSQTQLNNIAAVPNKVEAQDVTDTINTIFGSISITAWDDISLT